MARRRFLVLIICSIALLAAVTWLHLRLGTRDTATRSTWSSLDGLVLTAPAVQQLAPPTRRTDAARARLMARLSRWAGDLDDSVAVARANFGTKARSAGLRGRDELRAGQFEEAVSSFARSDATDVDSRRGRAAALARTQRLPEALHEYERLIELTPESATDRYNYAVCLARCDRLSDAADQLRRVLEIEPRFDRAIYNLAVICQQQGKLSEAIGFWQRFCEGQPSVASAWFNLATAFTELSQPADALAAFETAARLHPSDPITLHNVGITLRALGRDADAEAPLARAADLDPNDATALAELIDLHRTLAERGVDAARHRAEVERLSGRTPVVDAGRP